MAPIKLTCIHRQHFVIAEQASYEFLILSKNIWVESTRCEGEDLSLSLQSRYNLWVTVTLVHRRVCAQKVIVFLLHLTWIHLTFCKWPRNKVNYFEKQEEIQGFVYSYEEGCIFHMWILLAWQVARLVIWISIYFITYQRSTQKQISNQHALALQAF